MTRILYKFYECSYFVVHFKYLTLFKKLLTIFISVFKDVNLGSLSYKDS